MLAEFPVSGFCCDSLILLILQSSIFWLSSQIWFWKSLSFTFPEKRFQTWPVSVTFKVHLMWGNMVHITQPCWKSHDALHKSEWETCVEPDPAIPNATLGVPVKKGVLSEVLPSFPVILSISTPTVNKDVKQTQFAFIVLLLWKESSEVFLHFWSTLYRHRAPLKWTLL